jgi:cell division protein FtsQ
MNKKSILKYLFWGALFIYIALTIVFYQKENNNLICSKININNLSEKPITSDRSIEKIIVANFPNIIGDIQGNLNIDHLEKLINKLPTVMESEVYTSLYDDNGMSGFAINIDLINNEPIARLFSSEFNYYLDSNGELIPKDVLPTRLVVFTGKITTNRISKEIIFLAQFIHNDEFLRSLVEQVNILPNGEYEIFTKFSNQYVIFGNFEGYKNKFYKLKKFFLNAKKNINFSNYKSLNLKFKDIVVCTKR